MSSDSKASASSRVSALLTSSSALAAEDCRTLYQEHVKPDLALSYEEFDQTDDKGFRVLAAKECEKEAADLIEEYLRATNSTKSSLRWHIAQLRATAGDTPEAIRYAKSVLAETEDFSKSPLRWNDYVLATIAFLEQDKPALMLHRDKVAEAREAHFGNELNLKLLDSLVKYFDRDYKYATSHIGQ